MTTYMPSGILYPVHPHPHPATNSVNVLGLCWNISTNEDLSKFPFALNKLEAHKHMLSLKYFVY